MPPSHRKRTAANAELLEEFANLTDESLDQRLDELIGQMDQAVERLRTPLSTPDDAPELASELGRAFAGTTADAEDSVRRVSELLAEAGALTGELGFDPDAMLADEPLASPPAPAPRDLSGPAEPPEPEQADEPEATATDDTDLQAEPDAPAAESPEPTLSPEDAAALAAAALVNAELPPPVDDDANADDADRADDAGAAIQASPDPIDLPPPEPSDHEATQLEDDQPRAEPDRFDDPPEVPADVHDQPVEAPLAAARGGEHSQPPAIQPVSDDVDDELDDLSSSLLNGLDDAFNGVTATPPDAARTAAAREATATEARSGAAKPTGSPAAKPRSAAGAEGAAVAARATSGVAGAAAPDDPTTAPPAVPSDATASVGSPANAGADASTSDGEPASLREAMKYPTSAARSPTTLDQILHMARVAVDRVVRPVALSAWSLARSAVSAAAVRVVPAAASLLLLMGKPVREGPPLHRKLASVLAIWTLLAAGSMWLFALVLRGASPTSIYPDGPRLDHLGTEPIEGDPGADPGLLPSVLPPERPDSYEDMPGG